MPLGTAAFTIDVVIVSLMSLLSIALWRRMIPERAGHVVAAVVWWMIVVATLQSQMLGHYAGLSLLLLMEILGASIMLHTRCLVVSLLVLNAMWIPSVIITKLHDWP